MTPPEVALWQALRRRALEGLKSRRQHPFGPFILDFYCPARRLAIEVDGWGHNMGDPARDQRRDAYLAREGVRTLRFEAVMVAKDLDTVVNAIVAACEAA